MHPVTMATQVLKKGHSPSDPTTPQQQALPVSPSVSLGSHTPPPWAPSWASVGGSRPPAFSSASNQTRRRCHVPAGPAEGAGRFAEPPERGPRGRAEAAPASELRGEEEQFSGNRASVPEPLSNVANTSPAPHPVPQPPSSPCTAWTPYLPPRAPGPPRRPPARVQSKGRGRQKNCRIVECPVSAT